MWIKQGAFLILINQINLVVSASISTTISVGDKNSADKKGSKNTRSSSTTTTTIIPDAEPMPEVDDVNENVFDNETHYRRKKRQSGAGKFVDAAKMDEMRLLRMYLQLYKNVFVRAYVGGAHPLHHEVPKPIIQLFKQRVVDFFTPKLGADSKV